MQKLLLICFFITTISTSILSTNIVTFTPENGGLIGNNLQAGYTDVNVGYITFSDDSITGFSMTFDSQNSGKLKRDASGREDSETTYKIKVIANDLNGLGIDPPDDTGYGANAQSATSVSLSDNLVLTHDTNYTQATVDAKYTILVSTTAKATLFSGAYNDSITVTIASL